jgi:Leucine-rich repeat (LRR) protein
MKNLKLLNLSNNLLKNIQPLLHLSNIVSINLSFNMIKEIDSFNNMLYLETIEIKYNQLKNVDVLSNLTKLTKFEIRIENIDSLCHSSKSFKRLILSNNRIKNITCISFNLKNIQDL